MISHLSLGDSRRFPGVYIYKAGPGLAKGWIIIQVFRRQDGLLISP